MKKLLTILALLVGVACTGNAHAQMNRITVAPTVTASAAYTSGNDVGGLLTFNNAVRASGHGGVLQTCLLRDTSGQNVSYNMFLFDQTPSNTTVTDKTAVSIAAADLPKVVLPVVAFSGLTQAGTPGVIGAGALNYGFKLSTGTTLFGILQVVGAPTYATTTAVTIDCTILPAD